MATDKFPRRRDENDQQYAYRAQARRVREELSKHDEFVKLSERYPHPGPATMAKLEALYLELTGEKAPHLV